VILADFQVGQVLWSLLWFFLFFMWLMLVFMIFGDIIRSHDMSGVAKGLWALLIIFLPFLGVFLYLIVRGGDMSARRMRNAQAQDEAFRTYVQTTAGGGGSAGELAKLSELHAGGKLSDDEYAQAKAKALAD
jgi:hypothetical protein